jgi:hypothetical protein
MVTGCLSRGYSRLYVALTIHSHPAQSFRMSRAIHLLPSVPARHITGDLTWNTKVRTADSPQSPPLLRATLIHFLFLQNHHHYHRHYHRLQELLLLESPARSLNTTDAFICRIVSPVLSACVKARNLAWALLKHKFTPVSETETSNRDHQSPCSGYDSGSVL